MDEKPKPEEIDLGMSQREIAKGIWIAVGIFAIPVALAYIAYTNNPNHSDLFGSQVNRRAVQWASGDPPAIGISIVQARLSSWGTPSNSSTIKNQFKETEFWHFEDKGTLMFENGVLTSITERR